jgi:protein-tyrosine phosphatase
MKYGVLFLTLGLILAAEAMILGGLGWGLLWPGLSFAIVGCAYLGLGPGVFGKRSDGTMAWYAVAILGPYLALTWLTWHVVRAISREDCWNEVAPGLFIGRRPLAGELPKGITLVVDLTAEFFECRAVREGCRYIAAPMLDTGVGSERDVQALAHQIASWSGPVYIHCAQGHGRTGTVAAAVLLDAGRCATVEEAVSMLQAARPRLAIGKEQLAFLRRVCSTQFRREDVK